MHLKIFVFVPNNALRYLFTNTMLLSTYYSFSCKLGSLCEQNVFNNIVNNCDLNFQEQSIIKTLFDPKCHVKKIVNITIVLNGKTNKVAIYLFIVSWEVISMTIQLC